MSDNKLKAVVHCLGECSADGNLGSCTYGCLRCGVCMAACPASAISYPAGRRAAQVDRDRCIGCGNCVQACPQEIISLKPRRGTIKILCSNQDAGKIARGVCPTSCIGCGICAKACPVGAITIKNNRAVMDARKCVSCGMCATKCPRKVIRDVNGVITTW